MFTSLSLKFMSVLVLAGYVHGHGFITDIKGANGKTGIGFGVDAAQITVSRVAFHAYYFENGVC